MKFIKVSEINYLERLQFVIYLLATITTQHFLKKEKKPFAILQKSSTFQDAFISLINVLPTRFAEECDIFQSIEEFVCRMYGAKTKNNVNKARYEIFKKKCKSNESEKISKKNIKGFDAGSIPPTKQTASAH